jgi:signal transduction histidine kinase
MTEADRLALLTRLGQPVQHDVNNLLMAISGNLELLRRDTADPAALRRLDRIGAAMERLAPLLRAVCDQLRPPPDEPSRASAAVAALRPLLQVLISTPGALRIALAEDDPPQPLDRIALADRLLAAALAAGRQGPLAIAVDAVGAVSVSPDPRASPGSGPAPAAP